MLAPSRRFSTRLPQRLFGSNVLTTIDCHCGGLPARVLVEGLPEIPGDSAMQKREFLMKNMDHIRTLLITEPRGYPCQNLNIILPATKACPEAAFSYVIAENNFIYPSMSGHNTICVVTALLESGMVPMEEPCTEFVLEAPVGPIHIRAQCKDGKCETVTFKNAPSFAREEDLDVLIDVPTLGKVPVDIAFGGMWYAIVHDEDLGLKVCADHAAGLARAGEMVKVASREQHPVQHPLIDYPGCDNMAIRGAASEEGVRKYGAHSSNAVVMSTGELNWEQPASWKGNIDRSPCGTGTCAIMATMHARGELAVGDEFVHEGILGTVFTGKIVEEVIVCGEGENALKGIVPEVTGQAWVTQCSQVVVDPTDPFQSGYTLGDIWAS